MNEKEGTSQLIEMIANLRLTMLEKFEDVDERFEEVEGKVEEHDQKFEQINRRLTEHDRRFDDHDKRFDSLDSKLAKIHDNQKNIAKVIRVMQHDIENNKNIRNREK